MELADYFRIVRKRWMMIVAVTMVGIAVAAGSTILTTPKYQASSLVFVNLQSAGTASDLAQGGSFVQNQVKTYAEVVSTPRVLQSVVSSLHLKLTPGQLARSVTASAPLDTVNIEITVQSDSAAAAASIANAVTASFQKTVADITQPANGTASPVVVSVLRDATLPSAPIAPNTSLNLILGFLIGLVLGLGVGVLREVLDTRIRGERDVQAITDSPIIGGIAFDPSAVKRPLIVQDDPHSARAEAFRSLRTNLQFLDIDPGARSFVVTSSIPSEGKTTTAANLAIALADSGAHVVIIDADLRRPKLAEYMGLEGSVGLSDVLIARASLAEVLQPWGRGNLVVLTAGAVPPNPSELLGSKAMASLIRSLEDDFDVVIIDLPPLLPVTDAALVSKLTRGALLVVAAGRTNKGQVAAAVSILENVGARVAGVILTMLPTKGPDAYGYGRYGYGGYGYARAEQSTELATDLDLPKKRLSPDWGRDANPSA
jgi:succinoglycan biosynthesis transport protein ExoP